LVVLLAAAIWQLFRSRSESETTGRRILMFATLTAVAAPVAYCAFLETLSYLARSWYFLALVALLGITLDCLASELSNSMSIRAGRLALAAIALIVLPINAWPKILERQTDINVVAQKITEQAKPSDLIVLAPWQYAISF